MRIRILNVPDFCVSYYFLGLKSMGTLSYEPNMEYSKFDFRPLIIFEVKGKLVVIDNSDPVGVDTKLLESSDYYFATNKLAFSPAYANEKIRPLNPHYPINVNWLYLNTFWKQFFSSKAKSIAKEVYRIQKRPIFQVNDEIRKIENTIFFAGSIWKKEVEANQIRYSFINYCKANPRINFEGGFLPRNDGNHFGFDDAIAPKTYPPKEFLENSKKSLFGFNNAAVLGALSWRFAEYLNLGLPILSLPFKVTLKNFPIHGQSIHLIETIDEVPEFLDYALDHPEYLQQLALGGRAYFQKYCLPETQVHMIINSIN